MDICETTDARPTFIRSSSFQEEQPDFALETTSFLPRHREGFQNTSKSLCLNFMSVFILLFFKLYRYILLIQMHFYTSRIYISQLKCTHKNFPSPPSKDKDLVQALGSQSYKDWLQHLTQFRARRHQPRAFAGIIKKEVLSFCWSCKAISLHWLENRANTERRKQSQEMKSDRLPTSFEYLVPAIPETKIPGAFQMSQQIFSFLQPGCIWFMSF